MQAALKKCPFCGEEAIRDQEIQKDTNRVLFFVRCRNKYQKCRVMPRTKGTLLFTGYPSKGTAPRDWNKRT